MVRCLSASPVDLHLSLAAACSVRAADIDQQLLVPHTSYQSIAVGARAVAVGSICREPRYKAQHRLVQIFMFTFVRTD